MSREVPLSIPLHPAVVARLERLLAADSLTRSDAIAMLQILGFSERLLPTPIAGSEGRMFAVADLKRVIRLNN